MMMTDIAEYEKYVWRYFSSLKEEDFDKAVCLFCGESHKKLHLFSKGPMNIVRCYCGHIYNQRAPKEHVLESFYKQSNAMTAWSEFKKTDNKREKTKFKKTAKFINALRPKNYVDIGCGTGTLLSMVHCPSRFGIDTNESSINVAKAKKLDVRKLSLNEFFLLYGETEYDVVTAFGVLEHMKDPNDFMNKVSKIVARNGHLIVCVPNVESRIVREIRERCFTFCPQHLHYFSSRTLTRLLNKHGFSVSQIRTVEAEEIPLAKWKMGIEPYRKDLPLWAEEEINNLKEKIEKTVLRKDQGYKLIAYGKKL